MGFPFVMGLELADGVGIAPTQPEGSLGFRDRGITTLPTIRAKLAARVGLAPTPCGLTNRRATLTPPGNGAAGRILTCIYPLRRRMPDRFGHGSVEMVGMAGFLPAASRSQAECSKY